MAKSFDDLVKRIDSPEMDAKVAARTRQLLGEMLLSEVRLMQGQTQRQVAAKLRVKQPSLAKLEKQSDMQVTTLRKLVKALGGELEITARFPAGVIRLGQFAEGRATPA